MARAPRRRVTEEFNEDAIDMAVEADREGTANDLATVLDSLAGITGRDLKILVYRIPKGIGKWEYCTEIQPPFETSELMDMLKENFGAGDYAMRVMVEGKIKTTRNFSIAADRKLATVTKSEDGAMKEMLPLIIAQMNGSKSDMMAMMQAQAAQSQQMMQMMIAMMGQSQQSQATMITALMGGREKPAELIAAFAPLMAPKSGGFGEMVEMIKAVKEISGGGGGGGDDDSLMGLAKLAAPAIPAALEAISSMRRPAAQQVEAHVMPVYQSPVAPPPPAGPAIVHVPGSGKYPLLAAIREDVLFYFSRGADPEFAAEGVFDVLEKAGFKDDDFVPIVGAFLASQNWLDDLAAEGIDLRANPQWAQQFLNGIIALYNEQAGNRVGDGGGGANAGTHGAVGAMGQSASGNPQQGGGADEPV